MKPRTTLVALPNETLTQVFCELWLADLRAVALAHPVLRAAVTAPEFWKAKIRSDFYAEGFDMARRSAEVDPHLAWADMYASLADDTLSSCSEWGGPWLNDERYWRIILSECSPFGQTLNLGRRTVWWLHGHQKIRVAPGRYRLYWALRASPQAYYKRKLPTVDFIASASEGGEVLAHSSLPQQVWEALETEWKEVEIGIVDIPVSPYAGREWADVTLEVKEIRNQPKGGLNLDYARLTRVDATAAPSAFAVRAYPQMAGAKSEQVAGPWSQTLLGSLSHYTRLFMGLPVE